MNEEDKIYQGKDVKYGLKKALKLGYKDGLKEGFQKGKLEQKKEDLIFLQDLIFQDSVSLIKEDVRDRIKQLQKEIREDSRK